MTAPMLWLAVGMTTVVGCAVLGLIALRGFLAWIDLKRAELGHNTPVAPGARIEVADLKERVRRLEAIAAGVDI